MFFYVFKTHNITANETTIILIPHISNNKLCKRKTNIQCSVTIYPLVGVVTFCNVSRVSPHCFMSSHSCIEFSILLSFNSCAAAHSIFCLTADCGVEMSTLQGDTGCMGTVVCWFAPKIVFTGGGGGSPLIAV